MLEKLDEPAHGVSWSPYDNSSNPVFAQLSFLWLQLFWQRRGVANHYVFNIEGKRIAYVYIRKNACSAFRNLICQTSPHRARLGDYERTGHFLRKFHLAGRLSDVARCDARVFVYRDPIDRIVSLFVNKFVVRYGHEDMLPHFEKLTGKPANAATFADFVTSYLPLNMSRLDPHCVSQAMHLAPVRYTHAIRMKCLNDVIRPLIGEALTTEFFEKKPNATADSKHAEPVSDVCSKDLYERYQQDGMVPSANALITDRLRKQIETIYQSDFKLIEILRRGGSI